MEIQKLRKKITLSEFIEKDKLKKVIQNKRSYNNFIQWVDMYDKTKLKKQKKINDESDNSLESEEIETNELENNKNSESEESKNEESESEESESGESESEESESEESSSEESSKSENEEIEVLEIREKKKLENKNENEIKNNLLYEKFARENFLKIYNDNPNLNNRQIYNIIFEKWHSEKDINREDIQ